MHREPITSLILPSLVTLGGSGYDTVEDAGTPVTQRDTINFTGAGVSVADSGGKTTVTITGSAGEVDYAPTFLLMGA